MSTMRRSTFEYLIITLTGIVLAVVTSVIGFYANLSLGLTLLLVLTSEILLIEVSNYLSLHNPRSKKSIDVLRGERTIFRRALNMQKKVRKEICASWSFPRWSYTLEEYFKDAAERVRKKQAVRIHRIINVKEVGADRVKEHLISYMDMLKTGQYVAYSTFHKAFEYLVVDRQEALFLAPNPVREEMDMGIYGKEESFVFCLVELFDDLCRKGTKLQVPRAGNDDELKAYIYHWVDSQAK